MLAQFFRVLFALQTVERLDSARVGADRYLGECVWCSLCVCDGLCVWSVWVTTGAPLLHPVVQLLPCLLSLLLTSEPHFFQVNLLHNILSARCFSYLAHTFPRTEEADQLNSCFLCWWCKFSDKILRRDKKRGRGQHNQHLSVYKHVKESWRASVQLHTWCRHTNPLWTVSSCYLATLTYMN